MYLWAACRRLHPLACLLAAVLPFLIGAWISAISWLAFGGLLGLVFLRRRKGGKLQGRGLSKVKLSSFPG